MLRLPSLIALLLLAAPAFAADPTPVSLFNGKDLTGWVARGGKAEFRVEGNEIVGSTVPNTGNTFLCTEKEYGNFILEAEFKVDPTLNSGIQIRSKYYEHEVEEKWAGELRKFPAKRVHGLQVEIDPLPRAWTGGIHCEGGKAPWSWLNPLTGNEPARQAFKQNEWNHLKVHAQGDRIKTWINTVPAADLQNDSNLQGFIALQVHGIGKRTDKIEVRFRNLKLQELP